MIITQTTRFDPKEVQGFSYLRTLSGVPYIKDWSGLNAVYYY